MSALWKLEDAGIQVMTSLAKVHRQLIRATRVSLDQVAQTEYIQSSPGECAELVIREWTVQEDSDFPPTWRALYQVLEKLDLAELSLQIEEYLTCK